MTRLIIRLKSGYEIPIECESFTIKRNGITSEMESFDIKGITNNRPVFFRLEDVECIIEQIARTGQDCPWR
ncbi:hypothetical protein [Ruminococcus sp.]|uniref:hypothetical protein n=1 Tax=Ruminococcus sp. TaxID=41978 RepID=UPI00388FEEEB